MKKITSFIAAAFIAVTTFTSCEVEKSANNLVGTWELKSTTVYYENGDTKTTEPQEGEWQKYTFTQSTVTITSNDTPNSAPLPYTVEDDDIVIGIYGVGAKLEIEKLTNSTLKIRTNNPIETEDGVDYTISTYKKI
ncbi:MAG: hypothetical protein IIW75_01295 [Bacteroidaceae bacterium]|nr:hypothetical protein [Bacteroidaceae bacterium]